MVLRSLRRLEDLAGSGAKPCVVVCDDKFDALEPTIGKRAQNTVPESFSLGRAGANAQYLAAAIVADTDSYYRCRGNNPPPWRDLM